MAEYWHPKQVGIEALDKDWRLIAARQSRRVFTEEEIEGLTAGAEKFALMDDGDDNRFLWVKPQSEQAARGGER